VVSIVVSTKASSLRSYEQSSQSKLHANNDHHSKRQSKIQILAESKLQLLISSIVHVSLNVQVYMSPLRDDHVPIIFPLNIDQLKISPLKRLPLSTSPDNTDHVEVSVSLDHQLLVPVIIEPVNIAPLNTEPLISTVHVLLVPVRIVSETIIQVH
jgi:hypothetical protein